jgi:Tfp pilus assembly protein PilX
MKYNNCSYFLLTVLILFLCFNLSAKDIETRASLQNESRTLSAPVDLHLTDASNPLNNSTVDIVSEDAWLFFDNVKPSKVLSNYKNSVKINGTVIDPFNNCRLVVYKQGAVIIPHSSGYQPLTTFTDFNFEGNSQKYSIDQYYTNSPVSDIPSSRRAALAQDNNIRSLKLKRGYMATLANEPDGMGYSRCFIADKEDLEITQLPAELDGKVSFIRVFQWEWPSKKGWVGTYWDSQNDGLKYVDEQSDLTNSTWYYTWGASVYGSSNAKETSLINQEFVPEKWGKGGSTSAFYNNKRWSHLIGQNEPDHTEQSNVTVDEAIAEWPILMKTGARLGSPATTDYNWLYNFMTECEMRNYRVDFVVVHAYWGGKSASSWYSDLKKIHERTGRPIWIKEWNNGANWTNEGGWNGKGYNEANANKQLNDLKGILQVMDTASFIERYSIYNWVEDCRAIILNSQLTRAGEYYAANSPDFAFNPNKEVIPVWNMVIPQLSYYFNRESGTVNLSWTDFNGELTTKYLIEQSLDKQVWTQVGEVNSPYIKEYALQALASEDVPNGEVFYRIQTVGYDSVKKTSNVIKYEFLKNKADALLTATDIKTKEDWSMYLFENSTSNNQVLIAGPPTYRNRTPLVVRARNTNAHSFEMQLRTYDYLENPSFYSPDTLSILSVPQGRYQWGEVTLLADFAHSISKAWRTISFSTPFDVVPVVVATQITANDPTASAIRIKNVTKTGFDVCRKYEPGKSNVMEDIAFVAATPGSGLYDGENRIEAGITTEAKGVSFNSPAKINFQFTHPHQAFFGFMQTANDETAATLRLKSRNSQSVEIFKEKEKSTNATNPAAEIIGYIVLSSNSGEMAITAVSFDGKSIVLDRASGNIRLSDNSLIRQADIYSALGTKVLSVSGSNSISIQSLPQGVYIAVVNGISFKFFK